MTLKRLGLEARVGIEPSAPTETNSLESVLNFLPCILADEGFKSLSIGCVGRCKFHRIT
jgi:hypothetical protein